MARELWQWDPNAVVVTVGDFIISGYAPDTFVNVAPTTDVFTLQTGAGGEKARVISQDDSATLTLTLMEGSASNDDLSTLLKLGRNAGITAADIVPVQVERLYGTTLIKCTLGFVAAWPEVGMSADGPTREWKIVMADADHFVGGATV